MTRIPVVNRAAFLTRPEHRGLRVIALVSLLVAWEALARTGRVPVLFLPSPLGVLAEGWEMLRSGELLGHLASSLQRLVLGYHALVLVAPIDNAGQVPDHIAYVVVGDDHQLIQRREKPTVGGVFAMQALRIELVGEFLQLVADAVAGLLEDAAKEADVFNGDLEGDGSAATLRVLVSHEEVPSPCG